MRYNLRTFEKLKAAYNPMQTLARSLADYDLVLLRVIAARWDVDLNTRNAKQAAEHLVAAMLQAEKVEQVWGRLDDDQRGALQALLGAGGKMLTAVFTRMFGEIRPMGPDRLEREKPYLNPANLAEALYYRGLIAATFGESVKGSQSITYVPTDLAALMPKHQTGYQLNRTAETVESLPQPDNVRAADTSLVDDLTTLLAYWQLVDLPLENGVIPADHQKVLKPYLIGSNSTARLALLIALALDMGVAAVVENLLRPVPSVARQWLDSPRPAQVRSLAEAWRISTIYNELWHTPGLKPERTGWQNDPLLARQTVLTYLEMVPADAWWPIDTFVNTVKEEEADFQRSNGDYESWYIRDAQTNQYLRGFESWDKVDGGVLRFILNGPMHGLGLVDTAQNGTACRLTAYGRAFSGVAEWPTTSIETTTFIIQADGLCEVPRSLSRYDRFQLARFTQWVKAGDPYQYRLDADGLAQAAHQNIQAAHILTFLRRGTGDTVPASVIQLVELWGQAGTQSATLNQMIVLRVPTPELMETVLATPALRRYLGAQLGPTATAVRPEKWNELVSALQTNGIMVQVDLAQPE